MNQYKVGLEYANIKDKNIPGIGDITTESYELKGGYRFIEADAFQLYGNLSYYKENKDRKNANYAACILGVDGIYDFNQNLNVDGTVGVSVNGKYKADPNIDIDGDLVQFKVKLNYLFIDNIGASLGYRYYGLKEKFNSGEHWEKHKAFTLGLSYNF